ncbi:MAG TPA: efflux RND transporter periplasmic adaptor subunit [Ideonella sp.]|nr:efflux RND transporter periplasmic adaptor subunit [Ideonella sp.]
MAITHKQRFAIAAILALGLLAGGAVLLTERHPTAAAQGHGESAAHAEHGEHGKDKPEGAHDERGHAHEDDEKPAGKPADKPVAQNANHAANHADDPDKDHDDHAAGEAGEHHDDAPQQITLSAEQQKAAGIAVQAAGPAALQAAAGFQGEIRFNEDRTAHVVPRLAGVVESVPANLGQPVRQGQVLAVLASTSLADQRSELLTAQKRRDLARATYEREKKLWEDKISAQQDYQQAQAALAEAEIALQNATHKLAALGAAGGSASLSRFEIRAPFSGTVVEKHLALGEAVGEGASVFTVSDLSSVWAEFAVAPGDLAAVRVGQKVVVSSTAFDSRVEGRVAYVGSLLGEQTRTARARVVVANPQGAWRPGLYVTVSLVGEGQQVPVAVSVEALQTLDKQAMVFVAAPNGFVARPVRTGRSDGKLVEVLEGLKAGERIAASNTFVLKSELGKASAEHTH